MIAQERSQESFEKSRNVPFYFSLSLILTNDIKLIELLEESSEKSFDDHGKRYRRLIHRQSGFFSIRLRVVRADERGGDNESFHAVDLLERRLTIHRDDNIRANGFFVGR